MFADDTPDFRGLQFDTPRQQVWVDGMLRPFVLTRTEMKLLCFLAQHQSKICPRQDTVEHVYGTPYHLEMDNDRLDAMIRRVRKKIGDSTHAPRFLITIHGVGHRLDEYVGERS